MKTHKYRKSKKLGKFSFVALSHYIIPVSFSLLILISVYYRLLSIKLAIILTFSLAAFTLIYVILIKHKNRTAQIKKAIENQRKSLPSTSYKKSHSTDSCKKYDDSQIGINHENDETDKQYSVINNYSQTSNNYTDQNQKEQKPQNTNSNFKSTKNPTPIRKYKYRIDRFKPKYKTIQVKQSIFNTEDAHNQENTDQNISQSTSSNNTKIQKDDQKAHKYKKYDQYNPYHNQDNYNDQLQDTTDENSANLPLNEKGTSLFPLPIGFINLGNTCFFNASVQCLVRVMPLTKFILSDSFPDQINELNENSTRGSIALSYRKFLGDLCRGTPKSSSYNPREFRRSIVAAYDQFANYHQHDSQELLCALLDGLHEDMNQSEKVGGRLKPVHITSLSDGWQVHLSRNSSPIVDIFHGILCSSTKCPLCGFIEKARDPFVFLPIAVPPNSESVSLMSCISRFCQEETLDEDNKCICSNCKKSVCATKKIGVEKCGGNALIIHLKRFMRNGSFSSKIETNVEYPDFLDVSSFTKDDEGLFELIGVVFHSGSLDGGHYTAAAVDPMSGEWYNFNDSTVRKIDNCDAHSSRAYILFYQRIE